MQDRTQTTKPRDSDPDKWGILLLLGFVALIGVWALVQHLSEHYHPPHPLAPIRDDTPARTEPGPPQHKEVPSKPRVYLDEVRIRELGGQLVIRIRHNQPGCGEMLLRRQPQDPHLDDMTEAQRRTLIVDALRQPCADGDACSCAARAQLMLPGGGEIRHEGAIEWTP